MSLITWPIVALWRLVTTLLALTGRLVLTIVGLILILVGAVLTITVIGAPLGIPLIITGLLFLARGLF
jgi:hypothetical protein